MSTLPKMLQHLGIAAVAHGSADRAEQAVARVGRAYDRLERSITSEERRLSFWCFLLFGAVAGCAGAYVPGVVADGAHWLLEVVGFR